MIEVDEMKDDVDTDSVQNSFLNAETDQFGEPQDVHLNTDDIEAEPDGKATLEQLDNDKPHDDPREPGPSTRKRRRISNR